jgi:hypothetical protein
MRPSARARCREAKNPPGGSRDFVIQGALRASSETVIRLGTLLGNPIVGLTFGLVSRW